MSKTLKKHTSEKNLDITKMSKKIYEAQVRTVSGFQEFTHNGKESLCEETDDVNTKVFLRKVKK